MNQPPRSLYYSVAFFILTVLLEIFTNFFLELSQSQLILTFLKQILGILISIGFYLFIFKKSSLALFIYVTLFFLASVFYLSLYFVNSTAIELSVPLKVIFLFTYVSKFISITFLLIPSTRDWMQQVETGYIEG